MLKQNLEILPDGTVHNTILSDTEEADLLAAAFRQYPELRKLGKNIRIKNVMPVYMPTGMFAGDVTAYNMDKDQIDYLMKRCPEYDFDKVKV